MRRIVATLTIAYIIGIIIGLYKTICIIPFFIIIFFIVNIFTTGKNIIKRNKYKILVFIICISLGIFSIKIYNSKWNDIYNNTFNNIESNEVIAEIINLEKETKYQKTFKIKILNKNYLQNNFFLLKINTNEKLCKRMKLGSIIIFNGEFQEVQRSRNFGGFDYQEYLKSKNIYGVIKWKNGNIKNVSKISKISTAYIKNIIIEKAYINMREDDANFFLALSIGYKTGLSKEIKDSFSKNNLSHMLAISGMHISYMLAVVNLLLKPLKSKTKSIIMIIILLFFMQLTGNIASVSRSCIAVILSLIAPMLYRKSDQITNLALSALFILIHNPYSIQDVSFIFSYTATIGIIFIYPIIKVKIEEFIINKIPARQIKVNEYTILLNNIMFKTLNFIKETVAVTIASNIVLIPLIVYNYNSISLIFIFSNLIIMPFIMICIILSLILLITNFISAKINRSVYEIFSLLTNKIILISKLMSNISILNVLIITPSIISMICIYIIIILWIYFEKNKWIAHIVFNHIKQTINMKKIATIILLFIAIIFFIYVIKEKNLKIYFVDVGQGDCTLIVTPNNKKILIDGGGSEGNDYDVGKSVLLPYLLDRKIKTLDYIIVSHFDSDHVGGLLTIMEELKVDNVIVCKQGEDSKNYEEFKKIVKEKKLKVIIVKKR